MSVNEKMTAIADAIRDKTGGTEVLTLDDMAATIPEIYESGKETENRQFWENLWNNARYEGTESYYLKGVFAGAMYDAELFEKIVYPEGNINVTAGGAAYMFFFCNRGSSYSKPPIDLTEFSKRVNFSNVTDMTSCFQNARVKNLTLDLSNCTNISNAFASGDGGSVSNLKLKITSKCTTYGNVFIHQNNSSIIFMEGSEIVRSISFAQASLLNNESVQSIIDALSINATTKKLTFHSSVVNQLTDEQIAQIAEKGWSLG